MTARVARGVRVRLSAAAAVAVVVLVPAVVLAMAVGPASAGVRPRTQDAGQGHLRLVDQTYWRTPGSPFSMVLEVRTSAPVDDLELAAVVYPKLRNRSELTMTIDGKNPRNAFRVYATPLAELPTDGAGYVTVSINPDVSADGVYPVRMELREKGGGNVDDSLVTHLVNVTAPVDGEPLHAAVVLPVAAPPTLAPDGHPSLDPARASAIGQLAASLDSHPSVPLSLWPTPDTLVGLTESGREADKSTAQRLASSLTVSQLLGSTYVPTSLTAMLDAGLQSELDAQVTGAIDAYRSTLGAAPDPRARVIDERLDDAAIGALASQHVDRVIVPEGMLDPSTLRTTLTGRVRLDLKRDDVDVAVADAGLAAHFDRAADDAVLAAHQMLADLAQIYFDTPGSGGRGVVALPSREWTPSGPFLDALLTGLGTSPVLDPVTMNGFFDKVAALTTRGQPVRRAFRADVPPAQSLPGAAIRASRRRVDAFSSSAPTQNGVVGRLDRTMLISESSTLRPRDRTEYLTGVNAQIDTELRGVSLPRDRSITLTAREGEIPITITSTLPYPIRTVLFLDSDTLRFPNGSRFELTLARRNTTTRVSVQARTSGSFPVRVRLESPEGGLVMEESRMTVRSTALSGVGVGLSAGAAIFLLLWWGIHLRRARHPKEPVEAAA